MRMLRSLSLLAASLLLATPAFADSRVLTEWTFDTPGDLQGWGTPNHLRNVTVEAGTLQGDIADWDPFIISPQFEISAAPRQIVEIRLKTDSGGIGQLFWTNTTNTPLRGFSPEKQTTFAVVGDGQWHDYRVVPYWHAEGTIILLRLDFPGARGGGKHFAVDHIRIIDPGTPQPVAAGNWDFSRGALGWQATGVGSVRPGAQGLQFAGTDWDFVISGPPVTIHADATANVHLNLIARNTDTAAIVWASRSRSGLARQAFRVRGDGRPHVYNVDLSSNAAWTGETIALGISWPKDASGALRRLTVTNQPLGPAEIELVRLAVDTALPRAGRDLALVLTVQNHGGATASGLRVSDLTLPAGLELQAERTQPTLPDVGGGDRLDFPIHLRAAQPVGGTISLRLTGSGAPPEPVAMRVDVGPSLQLPRTGSVPAPQPVASDYEIGAFYFPGWNSAVRWDPIRTVVPERKPLLGWYDESNPDVVDWQIKWAVEHGIRFFAVDWYWSAGGRSLEHWLAAYQRAHYRPLLKWCLLWANHNAPNTHSEADQRAVTRFWIDHYFRTPEYYRIEDRPVVFVWLPANLRRDMSGSDGAKKLLDISQEMARAAGFKGIHFIAMSANDEAHLAQCKAEGYAMTSLYNFMDSGGKAADRTRFGFDLVAESSAPFMEAMQRTALLPFLPNLSTGWDSRPWQGERATVIGGRTVARFRGICEDAKRFADAHGIKRLTLGPLNEWGEGSYAEPSQDFGFGMYDAVRDVFARPPSDGWPPNYVPADVGLGPYDFTDVTPVTRRAWDFRDGPQGWGPFMGVRDFAAADGALTFVTANTDPAISVGVQGIAAGAVHRLTVRMKLEGPGPPDRAQLYWSAGNTFSETPDLRFPLNFHEARSLRFPVVPDGQYHDYAIDLDAQPRWKGRIRGVRFDPSIRADVKVSIERIAFE